MAFFNYKLTDYTLDTMVVPTASLQKTRRRLWSYSLQVKSTEHTPKTRLIFTTIYLISVRFISEPRPIGSSVGHDGRFSRVPLPVVSADCLCEQFWHGQGCPLFGVVHPAFPLLVHSTFYLSPVVLKRKQRLLNGFYFIFSSSRES